MPASLVASQFATLEAPRDEPDVLALDVAAAPAVLADAAIRALEGGG